MDVVALVLVDKQELARKIPKKGTSRARMPCESFMDYLCSLMHGILYVGCMMQEFKKLVRDKIPDLIKQQGKTPYTETLSDDEYLIELDRKLTEEIEEYQESKELEELADVLEVIYAICEARGHSINQLYEIREQKLNKRGRFSGKIRLLSVE